ncbi:MAG TPA: hypothetical protein VMQ17_08840 [Candidatus Sulfotelmatobacter sp.]|jgi:hypothetical protein|nr:hypothetical protein [Candidatus Sulfotelmatobacter sp.]
MPEKVSRIVLEEYELIGKNRSATDDDYYELVFKFVHLKPSRIATFRFDKGPRTSILTHNKANAKSVHDGDKFRIVLERVE